MFYIIFQEASFGFNYIISLFTFVEQMQYVIEVQLFKMWFPLDIYCLKYFSKITFRVAYSMQRNAYKFKINIANINFQIICSLILYRWKSYR